MIFHLDHIRLTWTASRAHLDSFSVAPHKETTNHFHVGVSDLYPVSTYPALHSILRTSVSSRALRTRSLVLA